MAGDQYRPQRWARSMTQRFPPATAGPRRGCGVNLENPECPEVPRVPCRSNRLRRPSAAAIVCLRAVVPTGGRQAIVEYPGSTLEYPRVPRSTLRLYRTVRTCRLHFRAVVPTGGRQAINPSGGNQTAQERTSDDRMDRPTRVHVRICKQICKQPSTYVRKPRTHPTQHTHG
jgi:hypothetical protein